MDLSEIFCCVTDEIWILLKIYATFNRTMPRKSAVEFCSQASHFHSNQWGPQLQSLPEGSLWSVCASVIENRITISWFCYLNIFLKMYTSDSHTKPVSREILVTDVQWKVYWKEYFCQLLTSVFECKISFAFLLLRLGIKATYMADWKQQHPPMECYIP